MRTLPPVRMACSCQRGCFTRLCLERLGVVDETDHTALVTRVFWRCVHAVVLIFLAIIFSFLRYIEIMRILQSTYWLEPAGSHGVWGLDDYHFLPFLFGSSQLRGKCILIPFTYIILTYHSGHKYIKPKSIHDAEIVEEYSKQYIYFACIKFINSVRQLEYNFNRPFANSEFTDQNCLAQVALTDVRRYFRCKLFRSLQHDSKSLTSLHRSKHGTKSTRG